MSKMNVHTKSSHEHEETTYILDISSFNHPGPVLEEYIGKSVTEEFQSRKASVHKYANPCPPLSSLG